MGGGEGDRGSVDEGSCVVDRMVGERGGMVDSVVSGVVGDRGGVDEGGSVVHGVVSNWGGVDERSCVVDDGLVGAGNALVLHVSVVLGGHEWAKILLPRKEIVCHLFHMYMYTYKCWRGMKRCYLLVLIDKVVNDLSPAVRQVDHVLAWIKYD